MGRQFRWLFSVGSGRVPSDRGWMDTMRVSTGLTWLIDTSTRPANAPIPACVAGSSVAAIPIYPTA